ncbi:hypothetical protein [Flagellimonas eckloniae]|uniref:Outer membrane protein beta-barrel domain-containing protein n=1 Tax=Flagellimonas eckloniae TaxID=346185 RepID=A0A0Q1BFW6_9FLAO|nr:hypothetical protein [Allomuricauda eckloniae]KQC29151.1 hypothetical protein AAY42_04005 [Allomuricauda eckloniae]
MLKNFTVFVLFLALLCYNSLLKAQEEPKDYIEFNDRKNVVHGVYLGLNAHYGELKNIPTYGLGLKMAYVANQRFEVGIATTFLISDQEFITVEDIDNRLIGAYIGGHFEPIFFSKKRVNLSFPLFLGVGGIGYTTSGEDDFDDDFIDKEFENVNTIFVMEPGVNALFNLSRYIQLEAGIKYRFTNKIDLATSPIKRLNGFSTGVGVKVGIFNMGKNRYKKNISEKE